MVTRFSRTLTRTQDAYQAQAVQVAKYLSKLQQVPCTFKRGVATTGQGPCAERATATEGLHKLFQAR